MKEEYLNIFIHCVVLNTTSLESDAAAMYAGMGADGGPSEGFSGGQVSFVDGASCED